MYYVIFDHDMSWDDGCDSDTHRAEFHDMSDAFAYAAMIDQRAPIESGECHDSWMVRRVMHDDAIVDRNIWSAVPPRDVLPDFADELLASDIGCPTNDVRRYRPRVG